MTDQHPDYAADEDFAATDADADSGYEPTPLDGSHDRLPSSDAVISRRHPWTAGDYNPTITRSGATKLADSGVAPLVAVARGYESIDEPAAKDFAERWKVGARNTKRGRQFFESFRDDGDVLAMPWFKAGEQFAALPAIDRKPSVHSLQLRPQNPRFNDAGKVVKYEFLTGQDTVLDFHPSATRDWIESAPRVLVAEGLLKGDSALTAQLRQYVSDDELALQVEDHDRVSAIRRLNKLMARIPEHERVAILSIAGVGNWRSNPEWTTVNLANRQVLIAFDGDVRSNWNVWHQAQLLMTFLAESRKAEPYLVEIANNELGYSALLQDGKLGLDDYFANVDGWTALEDMLTDELPARPARGDEDREGEWRVAADGLSVEECVAVMQDGQKAGIRWERRVGIGGRIVNSEVRRAASDDERRGLPFGSGVNEAAHPMYSTIQLSWLDDQTGKTQIATVVGPQVILEQPPSEWSRLGAQIPSDLRHHEEWPPRKGLDWLSAIKRNKKTEREHITTWSTMGYVPVEGAKAQAFIIGEQVIALTEGSTQSTRAGVTDEMLARAGEFGVHDIFTGDDFTDPTGKFDLREDIRSILRTYVEESPWPNVAISSTVLAQAIRPAVPLPTAVVGYHVGPPQQGKSWTAKQQMAFWQSTPGTWRDTLPGSAGDTFATTEAAVAATPIWVADDLAPSSDRRAAEAQEAKIGDLVRAVHNKLGKRRMKADMTAREVPTPLALLIITAENEPSVQSIQERVVKIEFDGLVSANMAAIEDLSYNTTTAARLTAAIIRMYIAYGEQHGWDALIRFLQNARESHITTAKHVLGRLGVAERDRSRPAGIIGDLTLGVAALEMLMDQLGMDADMRRFSWEQGGLLYGICEQVAQAHSNKDNQRPGAVLIDCIRSLLSSGRAYLSSADDPSRPPLLGDDAARRNMMLGWSSDGQGDLKPNGTRIGFVTEYSTGETVVFLSRDDAFAEAARHYPRRILPGTSYLTSWRDVWRSQDLIHPNHYGKDPKGGVVKDIRIGKGDTSTRVYGVPVSMEALFPKIESDSVDDMDGVDA